MVPEQREPVMEVNASPGPAKSDVTEVKIERLDWDQTQAILAAHPGKIVVLDLWATYCPPCRKELPGLVALQAQYPDQVVCVTVSLDYEGDQAFTVDMAEAEILPVLAGVGAGTLRNVLLTTPATEIYAKLKLPSIPAVYVYGPNGQLAAEFPDRQVTADVSYAESVTPFVKKLVTGQ
ncbi:MAG: TlpA family protein disulfide reductase [Planctomycetota bacterium]|nr:MAG: TlpA family protein disulfide reductase [Planctomycetota bacterium]